MNSGLVVIRPGLFTTVQDQGRTGWRAVGMPPGGVFDRASADLANALVGNPPDAAVLELTLNGGTYEARATLALAAWRGAPSRRRSTSGDGRETPLAVPVCFTIEPGDRLILGTPARGARAYLAVRGGWQTPVYLTSRSSETPIKLGDLLPCHPGWTAVRRPGPELDPFATAEVRPLRVIDGPDADLMRPGWLEGDRVYRVGPQSNRMGLRLEGPAWDVDAGANRVSAPVAPGAVQVAGGQFIVLGVACGTMGGYPHVAHVISADLDRLGQARPGDGVRFERVRLEDARRLDRDDRRRRAGRRAWIASACGIELAGFGENG